METQRDDRSTVSFQNAAQLAVGDVPELYRIVEAADGEHLSVGLKADARYREEMPLKQTRHRAIEYVPENHRPVRAGTGQCVPRRVENHADDLAARSAEGTKQFAVGRVPKIDGAVVGTAGQQGFGRVEGDAGDIPRLPWEGVQQLTAGSVPEVDGAIGAAAGQPAPSRVEGHARHLAALPFELGTPPFKGAEQLPLDGIPKRYGSVEAAAGKFLEPRIKGDALYRAVIPFQCAPQSDPGRNAPRCSRPPGSRWHRRPVCAYVGIRCMTTGKRLTLVHRRSGHQRQCSKGHSRFSGSIAGIELIGEPQQSRPFALALQPRLVAGEERGLALAGIGRRHHHLGPRGYGSHDFQLRLG